MCLSEQEKQKKISATRNKFSKVQKLDLRNHMKIALLGRFASTKFFIFILVYLKDPQVISPDVLSTTTYGYQTAIAFGLNSSGGHRGANDLVSENFRHVTGHHSSV